jgi:hypothetical protein
MTRLIDLTDAKFKIPANAAVIDYIKRVNPFAHSDLGEKLIELGTSVASEPTARTIAPVPMSCSTATPMSYSPSPRA